MTYESVMAKQDGRVLSNLELSLLETTGSESPWHGGNKSIHKHARTRAHAHTRTVIKAYVGLALFLSAERACFIFPKTVGLILKLVYHFLTLLVLRTVLR